MFSEGNRLYVFQSPYGFVIEDNKIIHKFEDTRDFLQHIMIHCSFEMCKNIIYKFEISVFQGIISASNPDFYEKRNFMGSHARFHMKTVEDVQFVLDNNIPLCNITSEPEPEEYLINNYKEKIKEELRSWYNISTGLFAHKTPKVQLFKNIYKDELGLYYKGNSLMTYENAQKECFKYGTIDDCREFKKFNQNCYRRITGPDLFEKFELLQSNNVSMPRHIHVLPENEELWLEKLEGLECILQSSTTAIRSKYPDLVVKEMSISSVMIMILAKEQEIYTSQIVGKLCIEFGYIDVGGGYYQKSNMKGA